VVTTGLVISPRGIATMLGMLLVGRLLGRIDIRLILAVGFSVTAFSLWQMTWYSTEMDWRPIVFAGVTQGVGLGFVFVPLSTVAFSTLSPHVRTEGAAIFNLLRNIGGSIGISVSETLFDQHVQENHASIAEHVSALNRVLPWADPQHMWSLNSLNGLMQLDQMINLQASMIAYLDDFMLMTVVCLMALPLVPLLHPVRHKPVEEGDTPNAAALD